MVGQLQDMKMNEDTEGQRVGNLATQQLATHYQTEGGRAMV